MQKRSFGRTKEGREVTEYTLVITSLLIVVSFYS